MTIMFPTARKGCSHRRHQPSEEHGFSQPWGNEVIPQQVLFCLLSLQEAWSSWEPGCWEAAAQQAPAAGQSLAPRAMGRGCGGASVLLQIQPWPGKGFCKEETLQHVLKGVCVL